MSSPASTFTPKQYTPPTAESSDAIQGTVNHDVAQYFLNLSSVPPITSTSIVHDNACGTGVITALIASSTSDKIQRPHKIHATDIARPMVDLVRAKAKQHGWEGFVETTTMDAKHLEGFKDNTFTHAILSSTIQGLPDASKAVKEIYRTVKPHSQGGVAIVTAWKEPPHIPIIFAASQATRGPDVPLRFDWGNEVWKSKWLEEQLREGGFSKEGVEISEFTAYGQIKDFREWCRLMWCFVGVPKGGWTKTDEEMWDEAVGMIFEEMKKLDNVEIREDGSAVYKATANVAILKK